MEETLKRIDREVALLLEQQKELHYELGRAYHSDGGPIWGKNPNATAVAIEKLKGLDLKIESLRSAFEVVRHLSMTVSA